MDVDIPSDGALSVREAASLETLNRKFDAIKYESCDSCWEDGFDLHVIDGCCTSCRRGKADPVKKWSEENKVHPGMYLVPVSLSSATDY